MSSYDKENFKQLFESGFTYISGFMRNVRRFGKKTALIFPQNGESWTYASLNGAANALANAFLADGAKKDSVIMFALQNTPEFVFSYIAAQKIEAIACPINFRMSSGEIALTIDDSKPDVFIYDIEFSETMTEAIKTAKHRVKKAVAVDSSGKYEKLSEGHISYGDYVKGFSSDEPDTEHNPNIYDEVLRLYTSGTTSLPKGVPINNINEVLSAHDVIMHFPLSPVDITMNMTPWFHRGGIHSGGPCPTLYVGGTVVAMPRFSPRTTLRLVEEYKITFLIGVPSVLSLLVKTQESSHYDLSTLKGVVTMGSPLEKSACEKMLKVLTPNIFNGYGTTESFWNTFLRPYDLPDMSGSAGRSCTDDDVLVVKAYEDRKAEPDELAAKDNTEVGEIIIRSLAKSSFCYYNNPEQSEKKFYKGYMYTGDLATWDENEFVTIVGRKDDMIICSGENIYPTQIEEILNDHEKVSESLVTHVPDRIHGQCVVAYIIKSDESLTVEELSTYCASHPMLSPYKRPRYYKFVESFPTTATGKKVHYKAHAIACDDLKAGTLIRAK
jgi:acyl-CoA synthetase (AMP-forming)/AMP-acid ligase II